MDNRTEAVKVPSLDEIRRELDNKIEKKLDKSDFHWLGGLCAGGLAGLIMGAFIFTFNCNSNISDKLEKLTERVAVLEAITPNKSKK